MFSSFLPNIRRSVLIFVVLTFAFSSIFWYLITATPAVSANANILLYYTIAAMWCPAAAAILTRFIVQRNLSGFALGWRSTKWQVLSMLLPIAAGLFMFGIAWISGIAPFNSTNAGVIFSFSFIPTFLFLLGFNCFAAFGEELGWRGLLVPELAKTMDFTRLALLSAAIWTVWHFPLILFSSYHGAGSIWYSLSMFIPSVMGAGLILAFLRLISGSVWVAVFFHGFWNYFIQQFFPALTTTTPEGEMALGEFGWLAAVMYVALAVVFWSQRGRIKGIGKALDDESSASASASS